MSALKIKNIIYTSLILAYFSTTAYSSSNGNNGRPSIVPENYITTPVGYFHPECVNIVNEGESINADGTILQKDGSNRDSLECSYPKYTKNGSKVTIEASAPEQVIHTWAASISHRTSENNGLEKIIGEWEVPESPYAYNGQTLFAFNSIRTNDTIIQPVLGFNQAGAVGPRWSIASWAVVKNKPYKSFNTLVNPGDIIRGEMIREIPNGVEPKTIKKWNISISVINNHVETGKQTISVTLPDSNYNYFDEGAYETYRNRETIECLEIALQKHLKPMSFTFYTKGLFWKNGYDPAGKVESYITDRDCDPKTSIDHKKMIGTIHY